MSTQEDKKEAMPSTRLGSNPTTTLEKHPLKIDYQIKPGMTLPAGTEIELAPVYVQQLSQAGYLEKKKAPKKTKSDR